MMGKKDPRLLQIGILIGLWCFIQVRVDFGLAPHLGATFVLTAVCMQWLMGVFARRPQNYASAIISGLSLSLLLRVASIDVAMLLSAIAIGSKFLLRRGGRHIINPSCFAVVIGLAMFNDHVWLAAGQWGRDIWFAFALSTLGWFVLGRCKRLDVALMFLCSYALLVGLRTWYLGDPQSIWWHALTDGSLILFTFYMITDPMTTPTHRPFRLVFAVFVACFALVWEFFMFTRGGVFYGLIVACLVTPLAEYYKSGTRPSWAQMSFPGATLDSIPNHSAAKGSER